MTTDNIPERIVPPTLIESRAEAIRELVFEAQAIVDLNAAAAIGDGPHRCPYSAHCTLEHAFELLDKAASMLEPGAMLAPATAAEASAITQGEVRAL